MKILTIIAIILAAIIIGVVAGDLAKSGHSGSEQEPAATATGDSLQGPDSPPVLYMCPRHPQEISTEPGKCSICGSRLEVMV